MEALSFSDKARASMPLSPEKDSKMTNCHMGPCVYSG